MFYGEFTHALDEKNRLIVPMRLRGKIKETFVERFIITKGLDNCLFLFTVDEWRLFENKTKALPLTGKDARAYTRHLFAGASECTIDKQGRISIPLYLKNYAQIRKDVIIIGVMSRIEIWSRENWISYSKNTERSVNEIAEQLEI
ncbi:MAG: division/cell wall cluster transcriptional repressor MraZ [bacterium]|nr:division/cell wall cluster transcriptional repressor MraZ [bacterium]